MVDANKSNRDRLNILHIDIETAPTTAYVFQLFDQNIGLNQIEKPGYILCFAAKWEHEKKIMFYSVKKDGHKKMLQAAWDLLDKADVVVHYNGVSFDIPVLRGEMMADHMDPPSGFKQVDLYKTVKTAKFVSRKLDFISQRFGIGKKTEHEGMPLWIKCMKGDKLAWSRMEKYNRNDVRLLSDLFHFIEKWIPDMPKEPKFCDHEHKQKRGYYITTQSVYQRYRCNNCGSWIRDKKPIYRNSLVAVDGHRV